MVTRAQLDILLAPGRRYYWELYAGYEPHPVIAFDGDTFTRCDW